MRLLIVSLIYLIAAPIGYVSAAPNAIHHIVLVWLNDPVDEAQREMIIQQTKPLADIPMIREFHIGKSISSERTLVDDSFDFGITMTFDSLQDMNDYIAHPREFTRIPPLREQEGSPIIRC